MSDDPYDLERFVKAQDEWGSYQVALDEIRNGRKVSHWMWWVFPQLAGLGFSSTSRTYSISSIDEAVTYLHHPALGSRLHEVTSAMNTHADLAVSKILHHDDVKFHSSMTLFHRAAPKDPLFVAAIDLFFAGTPDSRTQYLLDQ